MPDYPKRLIEVDLPIKRISEHARREKSIRHGHISTLHIWWARRPLAACRAVICAALWPDPADEMCPQSFRDAAAQILVEFAAKVRESEKLGGLCKDGWTRWNRTTEVSLKGSNPGHWPELRYALLDFIADFANWDASTVPEFLETSRALTQAAHEALGGAPGTKPLVVDPFAGGGSIPLEALRVGADAFASDLNPIPVLLNKVMLEYIPKYGQRLADEVRKWGAWIKEEAEKELAEFYPADSDGATPIAYLWARTIRCEGPGCGAEVPLMRSLWLSKKPNSSVALQLIPNLKLKCVDFKIIIKQHDGWVDQDDPETKFRNPGFDGTVKRSAATCPCCGYTTPADNTRKQFLPRGGGANDARLMAIATHTIDGSGIRFRLGREQDVQHLKAAAERCLVEEKLQTSSLRKVPNETLPYLRSIFNINLLGVDTWGKLFNSRQVLALTTLVDKTHLAAEKISAQAGSDIAPAVVTCLAFAIDRCADYWSSLASWAGEFVRNTFGRQALGIIWDYAEVNGFANGSGNYAGAVNWICRVIEALKNVSDVSAVVEQASACQHPLPNDSANAFITDPPYYDAVPYADLSDFFYVWLNRSIGHLYPNLFKEAGSPKNGEIVQLSERNPIYAKKTRENFESLMIEAMTEGRRILDPRGIGIVVFAHKTTTGWETQLQAMIEAGWTITASWPIDTERPGRLRANNAAALASSVHLICRPRENPDGSLVDSIGDWRTVLNELPGRIHEWMPRLASEGVVGADAIFACLGPALEIFSRYSSVEKPSGERVKLGEYLEHVWAAVANEAMTMIFSGADATSFEADARLTAMWFWTLSTGTIGENGNSTGEDDIEGEEQDDDDTASKKGTPSGYVLEYDAARKIAQGLGAHLERLDTLVQIKGDKARLLPVADRMPYLFDTKRSAVKERDAVKAKKKQMALFDAMGDVASAEPEARGGRDDAELRSGQTVLDRMHQSMLLFGAGRSEALKRFLVEDGIGADPRFWTLAQAFSALYPSGSEEKRWVDGVLARKKSLGF